MATQLKEALRERDESRALLAVLQAEAEASLKKRAALEKALEVRPCYRQKQRQRKGARGAALLQTETETEKGR